MAYSDPQPHTHKRLASLTGVALVHIALAFGLMSGLTVKYFAPEEDGRTEVINVPLPDPVPPEPDDNVPPEPADTTPPISVPLPPVTLDNSPPDIQVTDVLPSAMPPMPPLPEATALPPLATPPPRFQAMNPIPRNGPQGWLTTDDYPSRALNRGIEGTADYELQISSAGKVQDCRIVVSTGNDDLDRTTCRMLERRARFDPAKDSDGEKVAGRYTGTVTWRIPEG